MTDDLSAARGIIAALALSALVWVPLVLWVVM
jgi:hypothetical protein